jgi:hypothetical protein
MKDSSVTATQPSATWDGVERRSGKDRRERTDRRAKNRAYWERRSGQDRRGHPFYAPRPSRAS